ncbi:kinase-like domain-containing protein [Haematococcus lacustris]
MVMVMVLPLLLLVLLPQVVAAGHMLGAVKRSKAVSLNAPAGFEALVAAVGEVVDGYCQLAALPVTTPRDQVAQPQPLPQGIRRKLIQAGIPIVTHQLAVDPAGDYRDAPVAVRYHDTITFAGGINRPKVIKCMDQLGREYKLLVKAGSDDLRQDAVMQQFFTLINALLRQDREAAQRSLAVVGYKVVPFSPSAGAVEWVQGTTAMGDYLLGADRRGGAHARYKKEGSLNWMECSQLYASSKDAAQQRANFDQICSRFPPVMHHFFHEHFRQATHWFDARCTYSRSVAVASMAGWVLGLGDRHAGNILLDLRTAACVHIDLGVAFEQGRFLNTPELVPFRLTRDVVDGLGAAGLEGPMRRCSEVCLRVLRHAKAALMQVVEVMLHDPLYKWALTPVKAQRRQQEAVKEGGEGLGPGSSGAAGQAGGPSSGLAGNADAQRTVLRVKQKLEGTDSGSDGPRGVSSQVSTLLAEATDPDKLCRMFVGWAPWV